MTELGEDINLKQMRRNILHLAWPALLRLFLQSVVGMVDVIMVGSLGAAAIAAVDMGNRLVFVINGSLTSLTIGATALVAHYVGAKDIKKANAIMWQSLIGGVLLATVLGMIGFISSKGILR